MKYTDADILDAASKCNSRSEFIRLYPALYNAAWKRGMLVQLKQLLPQSGRAAYTDDELFRHAQQFKTAADWRHFGDSEVASGSASHFIAARNRGREFFDRCCAHMDTATYGDEELFASAKAFLHRGEWKDAAPGYYQAATRRGILDKCCTHMTPAANPYAGDYVIYAYEFEDRHVYVGLSFVPDARNFQHRVRGPVFRHAVVCPNYQHRIVERDIPTPSAAGEAEHKWMEYYRASGWTLLNKVKAGGTGAVLKQKWTKELVMAEARKYKTKQEWIDNSQFTYRLAKKMGWFDEAAAHMPKRVLGVGLGLKRSAETRQKLAAVAQARAADPAWRAAHSARLKGRTLSQAQRDAIRRGMAAS